MNDRRGALCVCVCGMCETDRYGEEREVRGYEGRGEKWRDDMNM